MKVRSWRYLALVALCGIVAVAAAPQLRALWAAEGNPAAPEAPVALTLPIYPPRGAVRLFTGSVQEMRRNWVRRRTTDPAPWTVGPDGAATPAQGDITSKQEFGDCYLHLEFLTPTDAEGKPIGHGNSGVGLQGRYEVQILNSYGQQPDGGQCGAFYSQKPPRVIASRPAGQWQSFDIIFRAPRLDANGQVTERPRATVFLNGVLVQNNEEFAGPTGIQYGDFPGVAKTGPIVLQGDHDPVRFRNIWVVPM